jgi:photosystem II stability/assembly factor-like uncharacterized protein
VNPTFSRKLMAGGAAVAVLLALTAGYAVRSQAETMAVTDLPQHTHIHGLAIDGQDLLIATHHGLFRARADGKAERISVVQDFMGFNPHPTDPETLYASGHPAEGGNLGFIVSTDSGQTWEQISPGVNGPVDFHQMTVSPADPSRIYGAYAGGLQASRDAGETWTLVGPAPAGLIDLAVSAKDADTLYGATETGLLVSTDAGKTWETSSIEGVPVSLVEIAPDGTLYAFAVGRGLVRSAEDPLEFKTLSSGFGDGYLLHLAADPANPDRLFGATGEGKVLSSADGGESWTPFDGSGS